MSDWDGIERRSGDERRRKRVYRFIDRRSGFDRRRRYLITGTMRDHPWMLVIVLVALNLMSLLDGMLTAVELATGIASEGNPILQGLIAQHPLAAVAFKIGVVVFVSIGIWRGRHLRVMLALALIAAAAYAAVLAYHFGSLRGFGLI